nr:helix-turn-helix domain-containing protein [Pseudomonas sp.]
MDIKTWVRAARNHKELTQTQLGEAIGVSKGNVSAWENGRHEPSFDQLRRIGEVTGYAEPLPGMANVIAVAAGQQRVPLLNYVQAGIFTEMGSNFAAEDMDYLLIDSQVSDRAFALQIKGDSMRAPPGTSSDTFLEGDRVIIDCNVHPRPGDYVVAKNGGEEATFKKYRLVRVDEEGREVFELAPLNPDYPAVRSDQQHLEIIGTMVEHRKYYRR